jgi:hypothetical protein
MTNLVANRPWLEIMAVGPGWGRGWLPVARPPHLSTIGGRHGPRCQAHRSWKCLTPRA